jgi:hypothetical protein
MPGEGNSALSRTDSAGPRSHNARMQRTLYFELDGMNAEEFTQNEYYEVLDDAFNRFDELYSLGYVVMMLSITDGFFIRWKTQ